MNENKFSEEQIKELLCNCNVKKCSKKAITYNKDFKIRAARQYIEEGKTANQIFRDAGFNIKTIRRHTPYGCLTRWKRIFKIKGEEGLKNDGRNKNSNGKSKTKGMTEAKRIEWLETEVAYLKAENSFLAKLRARKAE